MTYQVPKEILDDLSSRFIINIPEHDKQDIVRICFQVELAHWFYSDFYCSSNKLVNISFFDFAVQIFKNIPFLQRHLADINNIVTDWRAYKQSVPTYGAIILNEDLTEVLLVQSYFSKNSWSFPKGKINEKEAPVRCAIREVYEEIGFDITPYIDSYSFIELIKNEQIIRLYVIKHISKHTKFTPKTRCEIRNIQWFKIKDLFYNRGQSVNRYDQNGDPLSFFMVVPFIRRLRRFLFNNDTTGDAKNTYLAANFWQKFTFDRNKLNKLLT